MAAGVLDLSICFGLIVGLYALAWNGSDLSPTSWFIPEVRSPAVSDGESRAYARAWLFFAVVGVLYESSAARRKRGVSGQTPGKWLLRIRIVAADGSPVQGDMVAGRAALKWGLLAAASAIGLAIPGGVLAVVVGSVVDLLTWVVLLVAWLAIFVDLRRRSLFDRLCGTAVVAAVRNDLPEERPHAAIAERPMTPGTSAGLAAAGLLAVTITVLGIVDARDSIRAATVHWDPGQQAPIEHAAVFEQKLVECMERLDDPLRCDDPTFSGVPIANVKEGERYVSRRAARHVGKVGFLADERELMLWSYGPDGRIWFSDVSSGSPVRSCLTYANEFCDDVADW